LGKDKLSVFYGIGYAQGADRLWTLNLKRRMVSGRMAEIFGDAVLELDLESRNFDFQSVAVMNA
jgi:penicillin amidase